MVFFIERPVLESETVRMVGMHFTPTSSSWLNLVERFFSDLSDSIADGSFASVHELADTIIAYLSARNQNSHRYVWKAKGENILHKIHAARQVMLSQQATNV